MTDETAVEKLLASTRARWAPPPELLPSDFADAELIVTTGPLQGSHWSTDFAPYQRGILDAFHETGVEFVVVMGSSQWGKTSLAVALVAFHIAHDPGPILVVQPTVDPMAKDFAKNRLEPIIEASPILRATVSKKRSRNSSNTTLAKTFKGGSVSIGGANSAASLASRSIRALVLDEVDRYPAELPGEGATIEIAIKRTSAYRGRRRVFMPSSPTLADGPIHQWFQRGDQRRYNVPCPGCGYMHPYEWKNVKWDRRDPTTARLHCPRCDYAIDNAERVAVLSEGEWRAEKPARADKAIVSFHMWEAYSPFSSLEDIVKGFLKAYEAQETGDRSLMHTWQNTTLGEPVEHQAAKSFDPKSLLARRESFGGVAVPAGACVLTMGVDTQDESLEAGVFAWGPGEECWLVHRETIPGDTSQPQPWHELDKLLDRDFLHASGQRLPIHATCIDSAGHRTTEVYDYASRKAVRRVFPIIGRNGPRGIVSSPSPRKWGQGRRKVPLYTIGVDSAKALLMDRFEVEDVGPGYFHLPLEDWADGELAAQLTSERLVTKYSKGIPVQVWEKTRARNEALDVAVYALAALRLLNPDLELVARRLASAGEPSRPVGTPPKRAGWVPRRAGWLNARR